MARFSEQRLWDRIRRNLGRDIHIERIENSAAAGTPDTVTIHESFVTFVEHKVATLPKKDTTRLQFKHPLTPQQRNWHRVWTQRGGTSFIVIGIDRDLFAVPGRMADYVCNMTPSEIALWIVNYKELSALYKGERTI